jgi:hypothetical protein
MVAGNASGRLEQDPRAAGVHLGDAAEVDHDLRRLAAQALDLAHDGVGGAEEERIVQLHHRDAPAVLAQQRGGRGRADGARAAPVGMHHGADRPATVRPGKHDHRGEQAHGQPVRQ